MTMDNDAIGNALSAAVLEYLATGGYYMVSFKTAKRLYVDDVKYGNHVIEYAKNLSKLGKKINSTDEVRMMKK